MDITKPKVIYHICEAASWEVQHRSSYYVHGSLAVEGFIHLSVRAQVDGVLDRYFKGSSDLLLLSVQVDQLDAELIYEYAESVGEEFPHVYGPLAKKAIIEVEKIR